MESEAIEYNRDYTRRCADSVSGEMERQPRLSDESTRVYSSVLDAVFALLGEVVEILEPLGHKYVVVGGWSPYLLNNGPIPHPGTRDVDILFAEGASPGALRSVIKVLIDHGFLPSAKHQFQLLRVLRVADFDLVFNVDLLHPLERFREDSSIKPDMFVDHIELAVPLSKYLADNYKGMSIATPNSGFILEDSQFVRTPLDFDLPDGRSSRIDVPIMNEVGLIVTKSQSISSPKRPRDAFDIYVAISQCRDYDALVSAFRELKRQHFGAFASLCGIAKLVDSTGPFDFGLRIEEFIPEEQRDPSLHELPYADPYAERVAEFLVDIRLDE